ncbi:MAG TPA: M10 family metallopeptidase C-terminal domain-containing protein, partial [Aestuariivirga sp.]|nr:M10 family metallopeptidase C-terminal domain-containing protein [Aestuariivirga sp.]
LDGSNLADQFDGGDGNDLLHGQGGDDLLRGQGDDDQLFGEAGNDELRGDQGQDVLNGGDGHDVYYGGGDADTFKFSSASDTAKGAQRDIIMDFELGIDVIDLQGVFGPPGTTILFIGSNGFNNTAGELRAVVNTDGNTVISGDIDGDHSSDFQIELFGAFMLTGGDFIA